MAKSTHNSSNSKHLISAIAIVVLFFGAFFYKLSQRKVTIDDIKIYVINLDRSQERLKNIDQQLKSYNLKYTRFAAVDGYDINLTNKSNGDLGTGRDIKNKNYKLDSKYEYEIQTNYGKLTHKPTTPILTAGELGCSCSHLHILQNIVKNNIKYSLILEDDITLTNNFRNKFQKSLKSVPNNWKFIYLHTNNSKGKQLTKINDFVSKFEADGKAVWSTAAYLITLEGAKTILDKLKKFNVAIDNSYHMMHNKKYMDMYKFTNNLIDSDLRRDAAHSTIVEMGRPGH